MTGSAIDIGSRLDLFVDDYLIESMDGALLPTATDATPLPVRPSESLAVAVQVMRSPGLAVELDRVTVSPVPREAPVSTLSHA